MPSEENNGDRPPMTEKQLERAFDGPMPLNGDLSIVIDEDGDVFVRFDFITSNFKGKLWFTPQGSLLVSKEFGEYGRAALKKQAEIKKEKAKNPSGLITPEQGEGPGGLIIP